MAYSGHNGVKVAKYDNDEDNPKPTSDETDAVLDELYFEPYSGELNITVETEDEYLSIQIPVKADKSWNKFANSLPQWNDE